MLNIPFLHILLRDLNHIFEFAWFVYNLELATTVGRGGELLNPPLVGLMI